MLSRANPPLRRHKLNSHRRRSSNHTLSRRKNPSRLLSQVSSRTRRRRLTVNRRISHRSMDSLHFHSSSPRSNRMLRRKRRAPLNRNSPSHSRRLRSSLSRRRLSDSRRLLLLRLRKLRLLRNLPPLRQSQRR